MGVGGVDGAGGGAAYCFFWGGVGLSGLMGAFVVGGRLWVGGGAEEAEEEEIGGLWKCMREVKEGWTVGFRGRCVVFRGGGGVGTMVMGRVGRLKSDSEVEVVLRGGDKENRSFFLGGNYGIVCVVVMVERGGR